MDGRHIPPICLSLVSASVIACLAPFPSSVRVSCIQYPVDDNNNKERSCKPAGDVTKMLYFLCSSVLRSSRFGLGVALLVCLRLREDFGWNLLSPENVLVTV